MLATAQKYPSSQAEIQGLSRLAASYTAVLIQFGSPTDAQVFADGYTVQFICGVSKWYDAQPVTIGECETAILYEIPEDHWDRKAELRMLATSRATRERIDMVVPLLSETDSEAAEIAGETVTQPAAAFEVETLAGELVLAVRRPSVLRTLLVALAMLLSLSSTTAWASPEADTEYRLNSLGAKAMLGALDEKARYVKRYPRLAACFAGSRDRLRSTVLKAYFRTALVETAGRWQVDRYAVAGTTVEASPRAAVCFLGLAITAYVWHWENEGERADPATMVGLYQAIVAFTPAVDVPINHDRALNGRYLHRLVRSSSPALRRHWDTYVAQLAQPGVPDRRPPAP